MKNRAEIKKNQFVKVSIRTLLSLFGGVFCNALASLFSTAGEELVPLVEEEGSSGLTALGALPGFMLIGSSSAPVTMSPLSVTSGCLVASSGCLATATSLDSEEESAKYSNVEVKYG